MDESAANVVRAAINWWRAYNDITQHPDMPYIRMDAEKALDRAVRAHYMGGRVSGESGE